MPGSIILQSVYLQKLNGTLAYCHSQRVMITVLATVRRPYLAPHIFLGLAPSCRYLQLVQNCLLSKNLEGAQVVNFFLLEFARYITSWKE